MPHLAIQIERRNDVTCIAMAGDVDEHADLSELEAIPGLVELNLANVDRFNSVGAPPVDGRATSAHQVRAASSSSVPSR